MTVPSHPAVEVRGLTRTYPGVRALDGVDLTLEAGRVHALLGENGAGKSTLVRCLTGNVAPSAGEIRLGGEDVRFATPHHALRNGITAVYQELTVLPHMTVADNVMLGQERARRGMITRRQQRSVVMDALARVRLDGLDPTALAGDLSLPNQQLVEIARALVRGGSVLILDEPSAVLSGDKVDALHEVVREVAAAGTAVVYITHLLDEVATLADDVTVLRDGRTVSSGSAVDYPVDRIVKEMVGRDVESAFARAGEKPGDVLLQCAGLLPRATSHAATPVDLEVRAGEIVGLAGLVGSGRSRLLRTIAGAHDRTAGTVRVAGDRIDGSVRAAVAAGVVLVPEERKTDGLVLDLPLAANITLTDLAAVSKAGFVANSRELAAYDEERSRLDIRATGPHQPVRQLSGGNQQKAVIAKWLRRSPRVLIMDEPTRGIDVGAKAEIYRIVHELASQGMAVVFASSELPEVLGLADRVLVCRDGGVVGELSRDQMDEEEIMRLALGAEAA